MWSNYLTVGLRNLAKNKVYTLINLCGLMLGLAACLMILLYVRYETSYDRWLPDSDRIFQVQATWHETGQPVFRNQKSPLPLRETFAGGFPQVEAISIAQPGRLATIRDGQAIYVDALLVDPSFFDIFDLTFLRGSAQSPLPDMNSVVLTETEAVRLFGTIDAIGKTISEASAGGERTDYTVTGVISDLPVNSHMKIATLARFNPAVYDDVPPAYKGWGSMNQYHYVKLKAGADAAAINGALPAWEKRVIAPQMVDGRPSSQADIMDLELVNVADVHLGEAQQGAMTPGNDMRTVATFSVVALLILTMACVNFVNLSTARASQRGREVALRKLLGASRRQLITQFLGETVLLATIAMLFALALTELFAPVLASYLGIELRVGYLGEGGFLLPALGLILVVGVASGLYPAIYLSRFQPAKILKANKSSADPQGSGRLRNMLVVSQFAIAIGLIICTTVVYQQTRFVETFDPGFEREGLIQVEGAWRLNDAGSYDAFRHELLATPGVVGVARTNLGVAATNKNINAVKLLGAADYTDMGTYKVDPGFFQTMAMRLLAGRTFDDRHAKDQIMRDENDEAVGLVEQGLNVVINRKAAAQLGVLDPKQAVGRQIGVTIDGEDMVPSTIIGVVEDTRIRTARDEIEPLVFSYDPTLTSQIVVRYRGARPLDVMNRIQATWSTFMPQVPFEGMFAEDLIARIYERDRARGMLFAGFAGLAIIISCLGLFGLAAFATVRRTKEIGIRKVLGARVRDIVRLLVWQFSRPVVVANLIAWPAAWWLMRDWLNSFDVRIDLGPGPFALASLLAFAIAVGTVAGHALRAARLNPVHALRYE